MSVRRHARSRLCPAALTSAHVRGLDIGSGHALLSSHLGRDAVRLDLHVHVDPGRLEVSDSLADLTRGHPGRRGALGRTGWWPRQDLARRAGSRLYPGIAGLGLLLYLGHLAPEVLLPIGLAGIGIFARAPAGALLTVRCLGLALSLALGVPVRMR